MLVEVGGFPGLKSETWGTRISAKVTGPSGTTEKQVLRLR